MYTGCKCVENECCIGTLTMTEPVEFVAVNRQNVRTAIARYKMVKAEMRDALEELENIHTAYAEKRGTPSRKRQFTSIRKAMDSLSDGLKQDRL